MKKRTMMILAIIIAIVSCSNPNVTNNEAVQNDGRVKGHIHGIVKNANLNAPLNDCKIKWSNNGGIKKIETDSDGYFHISDLSSGSYEITFYKDDFVRVTKVIDIPSIDDLNSNGDNIDVGEDDYNVTLNLDAELIELNSALTGVVRYITPDNLTEIATGINLKLQVVNDRHSPYIDEFYEAVTNENGVFNFENLPSDVEANIMTDPFIVEHNGHTYNYNSAEMSVNLIYNQTENIGNFFVTSNEIDNIEPIIVQDNFSGVEVEIDQDFIAIFSHQMNLDSFSVSFYQNTTSIAVSTAWTDNNLRIVISPSINLLNMTEYRLVFSGNTVEGYEFFEEVIIFTE